MIIDKQKAFLIKTELENALKNACPVHDADLRRSIQVIPKENGFEIKMQRYGEYVEFGSPPHNIPVSKDNPASEPIRKWVKDKWGDEDLIYAFANHVRKHGTSPHPFVRNTLKREFPKILRRYLR